MRYELSDNEWRTIRVMLGFGQIRASSDTPNLLLVDKAAALLVKRRDCVCKVQMKPMRAEPVDKQPRCVAF